MPGLVKKMLTSLGLYSEEEKKVDNGSVPSAPSATETGTGQYAPERTYGVLEAREVKKAEPAKEEAVPEREEQAAVIPEEHPEIAGHYVPGEDNLFEKVSEFAERQTGQNCYAARGIAELDGVEYNLALIGEGSLNKDDHFLGRAHPFIAFINPSGTRKLAVYGGSESRGKYSVASQLILRDGVLNITSRKIDVAGLNGNGAMTDLLDGEGPLGANSRLFGPLNNPVLAERAGKIVTEMMERSGAMIDEEWENRKSVPDKPDKAQKADPDAERDVEDCFADQ